jgi:hypothetical protein
VEAPAQSHHSGEPLTMLLTFGVPLLDDNDRVITEDSIPK